MTTFSPRPPQRPQRAQFQRPRQQGQQRQQQNPDREMQARQRQLERRMVRWFVPVAVWRCVWRWRFPVLPAVAVTAVLAAEGWWPAGVVAAVVWVVCAQRPRVEPRVLWRLVDAGLDRGLWWGMLRSPQWWGRLVRRERDRRWALTFKHELLYAMWRIRLYQQADQAVSWPQVPKVGDVECEWPGWFRCRMACGTIPRDRVLDAAQLLAQRMRLDLRVPGAERESWRHPQLGLPVKFDVRPGANVGEVEVEAQYQGLPEPLDITPDTRPAPSASQLRLLLGSRGWIVVDLSQIPMLRVEGSTRMGKGNILRRFVAQGVQAGWLVFVVSGQGSPEYTPWAALPNVWYPRFRAAEPTVSLLAIAARLAAIVAETDGRADVCDREGVDKWDDLDDDLKLSMPRILVVVDELNILAAKDADLTKWDAALRRQIASSISTLLYGGGKYGISVIYSGQRVYASLLLGDGAREQAVGWINVGDADVRSRQMVSGVSDWPQVPNRPGHAVTGIRNDPHVERGNSPLFRKDLVQRIVGEQLDVWAALGDTASGDIERGTSDA